MYICTLISYFKLLFIWKFAKIKIREMNGQKTPSTIRVLLLFTITT